MIHSIWWMFHENWFLQYEVLMTKITWNTVWNFLQYQKKLNKTWCIVHNTILNSKQTITYSHIFYMHKTISLQIEHKHSKSVIQKRCSAEKYIKLTNSQMPVEWCSDPHKPHAMLRDEHGIDTQHASTECSPPQIWHFVNGL